jgi:hypothetical protein
MIKGFLRFELTAEHAEIAEYKGFERLGRGYSDPLIIFPRRTTALRF